MANCPKTYRASQVMKDTFLKEVRKLCLNENWNTLENENTHVTITNIVI